MSIPALTVANICGTTRDTRTFSASAITMNMDRKESRSPGPLAENPKQ